MKKIINFSLIGASLVFLFNPNVNIIDFLPDFVGYIILCVALTNLADISETVAEAHAIFKKLILIDAAKLVAMMWVFGMSVVSERNSSLLLWSVVLGVLELLFASPAFIKLFSGIMELGYLHNNTSVLGAKKEGARKNYTDKIKGFTVFFVGFKAILSFLPELSDLTSTAYSDNVGVMNMYQYIGLMRAMCFLPVLVIGIVWAVKCVKYFRRVSRDEIFVKELESIYVEKVAPKSGRFVKRNIAVAFSVLLAAMLFSLDIRIENVNVLPDFISALLLVAFFLIISKKTKVDVKLPLTVSFVYFAVSVWAYASEMSFFNNFYYGAVYRSEDAMSSYVLMAVSACVSTLVFVLTCLCALRCINAVIEAHTGVISVSDTIGETQQNMNRAIKREQRRYVFLCIAVSVVYAATDVCYALLFKDYKIMTVVSMLGGALFVMAYVKLYLEVSEAVNSKYILE